MKTSSFFILSVLSLMLALNPGIPSVQGALTIVALSPETAIAGVGQTFCVDVEVTSVVDLFAWEFQLGWDPSLLDVVSMTEGSFLSNGGSTFFTFKVNNTIGRLIVDDTLVRDVAGVTGDGTLVTITFSAKAVGDSILDLYEPIFLDSIERTIQCATIDGYASLGSYHEISVMSIEFSPVDVLPGIVVLINVTASNQGIFPETFQVTAFAASEIVGVQSLSLAAGSHSSVQFSWNTAGESKGEYAISASASIVPGETDIFNNNMTALEMVTILSGGHDVGVADAVCPKTVICSGMTANISVLVANFGAYPETFDVTVKANATVIGTQTATLASGGEIPVVFVWNTSSCEEAIYTLTALAEQVLGETDISDNSYTVGSVIVSLLGDITSDGVVNILDIVVIALAFGSQPASQNWRPDADVNNDGKVNILDVVIVALHYGNVG